MDEAAARVPDRSLVGPTWIVIIGGWILMLLPFPGTGWIGGMAAGFGGSVLAVVSLVRGVVGVAIAQLVLALVLTPIFYLAGLAIFAMAVVSALAD